jgi:hypothetical protein
MWTSRRGDLARYEKPRFRRMSKAARVTGNRPALSDARSGELYSIWAGLDTGYQFSAARPRHWLLFARDA